MHLRPALRLLIFVVALVGPAAFAGEPVIARFVSFHVRPESKAAMETAIREQMEWRRGQNDPWRWLVWESLSGERSEFTVATFGHDWADYESAGITPEFETAQKGAVAALSTTPPTVRYFEHLLDVSQPGTTTSTPTVAEISVVQLHFGKTAQFYGALKDFQRALADGADTERFEWFELRSGGEQPTFLLFLPRTNWAACNSRSDELMEHLEQSFGRRATTIFDRFTSAVRRHERQLVRLRPDLSLLPPPAR